MVGKQKSKGNIVIAIYSHIDGYPPSLNAVHHLSQLFGHVTIVERNYGPCLWTFPSNVEIRSVGPRVTLSTAASLSIIKKIVGYIQFTIVLRGLLKKKRPSVLLLYDGIPLALTKFIKLPSGLKLWYHNHDVLHESELKRNSFQWYLKKYENEQMRNVDVFSLPTATRLSYFLPISALTKIQILPNYPSKFVYGSFFRQKKFDSKILRLIHQGVFEPANFEKFIFEYLKINSSYMLEFTLTGPSIERTQNKIDRIKRNTISSNRIFLLGRIDYEKLPIVTREHHIGLALYDTHNIMVRTIGTASNKIFEYISLGLPVIFTDREDFRVQFGHYSWAFFVDDQYIDLGKVIADISSRYDQISMSARTTFLTERNFEIEFEKIAPLLE